MIVRELVNLIGFKINQGQLRAAEQSVVNLKNGMQKMGLLGSALITAPFVGLTSWLVKSMSLFEGLNVSFETMLGSAEASKKLVTDMLEFAAKTPFEIVEIGPAVKQLLAMGSSADEVLDELKMLGDVAAGLGVPITRLGLNFGQVRSQTKLTGRELRDFAIAGVPLLEELAKMMGVSKEVIMEMTSKGQIKFEQVKEAFRRMSTGSGRFANLMIKKSKTLGGVWSNFKDLLTLTAMDMSKYLLPVFKKFVLVLYNLARIFREKVSPEFKIVLFWMGAFAAIIPPLLLVMSAFIGIGMGLAKMWSFLTLAASANNITMGALLIKYALMAAAVIAFIALIALLIEDTILYTQNQDSMMGKILPPWDELKKKIDAVVNAFNALVSSDFAEGFKFGMSILWDFMRDFLTWLVTDWIKGWEWVGMALHRTVKIINILVDAWTSGFEKIGVVVNRISDFIERLQNILSFGFTGIKGFGKRASFEDIAREEEGKGRSFAGLPTRPSSEPSSTMSTRQINVNSTINTYVPPGTPAAQAEALRTQAQAAVKDTFTWELNNLILGIGEVP